ncbi:MAG: hypothetical protein CMK05_04225 [Ponticaulis sp.]|nr:hypothetical protein [Ponticaulis sp.]|tara:strand:- start:118810 stop:119625 length:816 start_codon:yes stop_codon:yes gene_type:complete
MAEIAISLEEKLRSMAKRLQRYGRSLISLASQFIAPGTQDSAPMIQQSALTRMQSHIRRAEYMLRCYILWMAAEMCRTGLQPAPKQERAPLGEQVSSVSPLIQHQERERIALTSGRIRIGGFRVTTPEFSNRKSTRRKRVFRLAPDPLSEVDAGYILARLNRLPRILKRADVIAERLVWKALNCHPGMSADISETKPHPLYFRPLQTWLPPEVIWNSGAEEDERADLNNLHLEARCALEEIGLGIPPPGHADTLPELAAFKPPPPPQIRSC